MKSPQQELREAAVVAGCTVVWTAAAVVSFDHLPGVWFRQSAATFAPATGKAAAAWFLPIAILILFIAGWMASLGLIFKVFRWHIRDEEAPAPQTEADTPPPQHSPAVQEPTDILR